MSTRQNLFVSIPPPYSQDLIPAKQLFASNLPRYESALFDISVEPVTESYTLIRLLVPYPNSLHNPSNSSLKPSVSYLSPSMHSNTQSISQYNTPYL